MTRRVQIILLAALAIILLMTVLPPVNFMSNDSSGGIVKVSPAIRYEFLFTGSCKEINCHRLFLQYLIVLIVSMLLVLSQRKASASLVARVGELRITNDKLLQHIDEGKSVQQQLRQQSVALAAAKEKLGRQVDELKSAEQKWHTYRARLEQCVKQQAGELASVNKRLQDEVNKHKQTEEKATAVMEQLQREITERGRLEESLGQKMVELASANERIQYETNRYRILEEQSLKDRQRYNRLLEEHLAQVDESNERIREKMVEPEPLAQSDELEPPQIQIELFDVKKMKAVAELAKRLSRK